MSANDENVKPEQHRPIDVHPVPEKPEPADEESLAPTAVQPDDGKDASEHPVVNPVSGTAI